MMGEKYPNIYNTTVEGLGCYEILFNFKILSFETEEEYERVEKIISAFPIHF